MQTACLVHLLDSLRCGRPEVSVQRVGRIGGSEPSDMNLGEARRIRTLTDRAEILQRLESEVVVRLVFLRSL
jgi:hypothetical protein